MMKGRQYNMINTERLLSLSGAPDGLPHAPPGSMEGHEEQMMALHTLQVVPLALLEQVQQLFGSQDRRCLNGQAFLAQWLQVARIEQIPLLPHEPPQPVAVLTIQSLRGFCTSPLSAWPWCYDTTAKYLSVLQASGLLLKVKQPKGMGTTYYFPLTSTPCLPVCAEQVQQLTSRRKSVRRSRALQRVAGGIEEQTPCVESDHDGKDAGAMKTRPGYLRLVPPPQEGQHEQGTHDDASHMTKRRGEFSGKEEQVGRTVERLTAMMQSSGMRLTPAMKVSIATIVWEELTHSTQAVSPQPPEGEAPMSSSPETQTKPLRDVMLQDRTTMVRQSRRFRRRSRITEGDHGPQPKMSNSEENRRPQATPLTRGENRGSPEKPSTPEENRRPQASTSMGEENRRLPAKPSTLVEDRRPLVQETVDLCGTQTQTHTRTHARARVEFNFLNNNQLPKKEIYEKSEDELREQDFTQKEVDGCANAGEQQSRLLAVCSDQEGIDASSPTLSSPAQEETSPLSTSEEGDGPLLSLRDQVAAMKRVYESVTHELLEALALDYSQRFNQTSENVGVYLKRMHEHPEWLHVAAVDALVRTWFPDPGRRVARLGGGWVIKKYREYVEEQEEPPSEMVAWAEGILNGGLTYDHLEWVLEVAARSGRFMPGEGKRPLPHEVMIEAGWLQEFWAAGGAQGLEPYGYLFVDRDGEFLTPQEYEQYRQAAVNEMLATPYDANDAEVMYEIQTYLIWAETQRLPVDEEQALLTDVPRPLVQWVSALHRRIDTDRYCIGVRLAPRSRRRVIEIREKSAFGQVWHLRNQQQILQWLQQNCPVPVEQQLLLQRN